MGGLDNDSRGKSTQITCWVNILTMISVPTLSNSSHMYLNVLTIAKFRRLLQCRQFYMKNTPDCISLLSLLNHICIEKFKIFIFLLCHILKRIFYILLWFESQHENPHYIMGILLIWPPFPSLYNTFLGTQYG